ncbi:MAG TPA: substrate-binding domain-containing protein [Streptosporangiaceae bacterium]
MAFAWWPCNSEKALSLAAAGLVHAAGVHLCDLADQRYNTKQARLMLGGKGLSAEVTAFSAWREGLVLAPGLAGSVSGVGDLVRLGLRVVNREPGSEARQVLDRELLRLGLEPAALPGYDATQCGEHVTTL